MTRCLCVVRLGVAFAMLAAGDTLHAEASIRGRFLIRYLPIFCKRSPCPRGSYSIEIDGKRVGLVKTVAIDTTTAPTPRHFIESFRWGNEPLAINGTATLTAEGVVLHADRAVEGEWKP